MQRYAAGDDAAFAEVYDALGPRLFAFVRRQVREAARAEDLMQQTFLQMHRARGSFIPGAAVLPWAFAIARRLSIDELRRKRRDVIAAAGAADPDDQPADGGTDDQMHAEQLARRLQVELSRLPEAQRIAFELLRHDGLSHLEAAQVLGTTVSAVKLRAHRAYTALRAAIGEVLDAKVIE